MAGYPPYRLRHSRAKKKVVVEGRRQAVLEAISTDSSTDRQSMLSWQIKATYDQAV